MTRSEAFLQFPLDFWAIRRCEAVNGRLVLAVLLPLALVATQIAILWHCRLRRAHEHADPANAVGLLGTRCEWPVEDHATEKVDELAPPHATSPTYANAIRVSDVTRSTEAFAASQSAETRDVAQTCSGATLSQAPRHQARWSGSIHFFDRCLSSISFNMN